jgi:protein-disulfide isomerase
MSLRPPVTVKDNIDGNADAIIELVEYGDYQCPYCGQAYPIVKSLQKIFGDDLRFVFRNFPLSKIHPQAMMAAVASEAAAMQDKFWEMHDIIFENQTRLHRSALIEYATLIGLDENQFVNDLTDEILLEKVEKDFESGLRSGVNATPTFFINGEKYTDSWQKEILEEYITKIILLES